MSRCAQRKSGTPPSTAPGSRQTMFPVDRPEPCGRVVLLPREPEPVELGGHAVGDGTLLAGRARDGAQLEEEVDDP